MKTLEGKVVGYALLGLAAYIVTTWMFARVMMICQREIDSEERDK